MPGALIIVTGPPGVGKTTVAERLAESAERPTVHLVTDHFYRYIRAGYIAPFLPEAHRQNEVVITAITSAAVAFAEGGYDVVIDGIVGPWFLESFISAAGAASLALHYVVLRPSVESALARGRGRAAEELRDDSVIRDLHEQFADLGDLEAHRLDSTSLDVAETVDAVRDLIAGGTTRLT